MIRRVLLTVLCLMTLLHVSAFAQSRLKTGLQSLPGKLPPVKSKINGVQYDFDLSQEKFYIYVPDNFSDTESYGLFVFLSPNDDFAALPPGWEKVLQKRKLICIAPQKIGNSQDISRRVGLAVIAALKISEFAKIDKSRIYVAGLSGGARVASYAAFAHPDLFDGVFAVCGVNFCRKVPRVKATRTDEYGYFSIDKQHADAAKARVKFALVTGSKDFRYGNILDIYNGGFVPDGYKVKLFDVPGMEHQICSAQILNAGLNWFEKDSPGR
jgi:hypothetical protein